MLHAIVALCNKSHSTHSLLQGPTHSANSGRLISITSSHFESPLGAGVGPRNKSNSSFSLAALLFGAALALLFGAASALGLAAASANRRAIFLGLHQAQPLGPHRHFEHPFPSFLAGRWSSLQAFAAMASLFLPRVGWNVGSFKRSLTNLM